MRGRLRRAMNVLTIHRSAISESRMRKRICRCMRFGSKSAFLRQGCKARSGEEDDAGKSEGNERNAQSDAQIRRVGKLPNVMRREGITERVNDKEVQRDCS